MKKLTALLAVLLLILIPGCGAHSLDPQTVLVDQADLSDQDKQPESTGEDEGLQASLTAGADTAGSSAPENGYAANIPTQGSSPVPGSSPGQGSTLNQDMPPDQGSPPAPGSPLEQDSPPAPGSPLEQDSPPVPGSTSPQDSPPTPGDPSNQGSSPEQGGTPEQSSEGDSAEQPNPPLPLPQETDSVSEINEDVTDETGSAQGLETDVDVIRGPMVALTFDDGPGRHTERILDTLEQHGGRVTFFVLGQRIETHRDTVTRAVNLGNEVAGHSWSHRALVGLSEGEIAYEIQSTGAAIEGLTGVLSPIFRPPYGRINGRVERVSAELGYSIVNWTVDTNDWRHQNADIVYNAVMREIKGGAIILFHDIHASTAEAMERLIPDLIANGYQLVTVSEILTHVYGGVEPGRVYGSYIR